MMKEIKCPHLRTNLKFTFECLTNLTYQTCSQIEKTNQDAEKWWRQELWECTDILFNDYAVSNDDYDWMSEIGYSLYDEEEAQKIQDYMHFFEQIVKYKIGYNFNHDDKSP